MPPRTPLTIHPRSREPACIRSINYSCAFYDGVTQKSRTRYTMNSCQKLISPFHCISRGLNNFRCLIAPAAQEANRTHPFAFAVDQAGERHPKCFSMLILSPLATLQAAYRLFVCSLRASILNINYCSVYW